MVSDITLQNSLMHGFTGYHHTITEYQVLQMCALETYTYLFTFDQVIKVNQCFEIPSDFLWTVKLLGLKWYQSFKLLIHWQTFWPWMSKPEPISYAFNFTYYSFLNSHHYSLLFPCMASPIIPILFLTPVTVMSIHTSYNSCTFYSNYNNFFLILFEKQHFTFTLIISCSLFDMLH